MISQGDVVYLDIGKDKKIRPQEKGIVYRRGKEIFSPETGDLIGETVKEIGILEVTEEIQDKTATARIKLSREPIQVEDMVQFPRLGSPEMTEVDENSGK